MSGSKLDQLVKGAAPPGTSISSISSRSPSPAPAVDANTDAHDPSASTAHTSDPLANVPSSPPQIYLNLLILEASLRSQYLTLRARRRQNTFFLSLLALWIIYFFYALFLHPREDGSGIGGSVYWVVEMTEKVALMGGVVTGILIWGTGQWERGVRWPRRFVGVTNRGLRTINCKMVVIRGPWWRELLSHLAFLFPFPLFSPSTGSSYHYLDASAEKRVHHFPPSSHHDSDTDLVREEDLAPGGDHIKLLLLPKPFSPDFRENWELYRSEYWEKENERRAALLQRLRKQERQRLKEQGGWLRWTGWRGWKRAKHSSFSVREGGDLEKTHTRHLLERDAKSSLGRRSGSHSRATSRSSTPATVDGEERPSGRLRRGSSSGGSVGEGRRRQKASSAFGGSLSRLTAANAGLGHSPLVRGASSVGTSSGNESEGAVKVEAGDGGTGSKKQSS